MSVVPRAPTIDPAALAGLYPELVRFARKELLQRQLDRKFGEDVVQDAIERWLRGRIQYRSAGQARAWFRTAIRRIVIDRVRRPGRDILDQVGVYSLDADWAHRFD